MGEADKLRGAYRKTYCKVETYGYMHGYGIDEIQNKLVVVAKTLLEAQRNEIRVEMVVGYDMEQFCKDWYGEQTQRQRIHKALINILFLACSIFFLCGYDLINKDWKNILYVHIDMTRLCGVLVVGLLLQEITCRISNRLFIYQWFSKGLWGGLQIVQLFFLMLFILFIQKQWKGSAQL